MDGFFNNDGLSGMVYYADIEIIDMISTSLGALMDPFIDVSNTCPITTTFDD